jgi:tRNA pseudouridine38-40 synthase
MDEVAPMFHARTNAVAKQYSYQMALSSRPLVLDRLRYWGVPPRLDVARMVEEAHTLVGKQDLKSFQASDCGAHDTVREIYESELTFNAPYLIYRVVGSGFLKHAVRTIVGTLVEIGLGNKPSESISSILSARDRRRAGMTAPAHGLCLDWVHYPAPYTLPEPYCWPRARSCGSA